MKLLPDHSWVKAWSQLGQRLVKAPSTMLHGCMSSVQAPVACAAAIMAQRWLDQHPIGPHPVALQPRHPSHRRAYIPHMTIQAAGQINTSLQLALHGDLPHDSIDRLHQAAQTMHACIHTDTPRRQRLPCHDTPQTCPAVLACQLAAGLQLLATCNAIGLTSHPTAALTRPPACAHHIAGSRAASSTCMQGKEVQGEGSRPICSRRAGAAAAAANAAAAAARGAAGTRSRAGTAAFPLLYLLL
jgi:hypothetical protein